MDSHVEPVRQGNLFELPFTLLPHQAMVVRWRLRDELRAPTDQVVVQDA